MSRQLTRNEVEAELQERASSIERRLDSLEQEAQSFGQSVLRFIYDRPFVSVGGAVALGLLLGLLFRGRRSRGEVFDIAKAHSGLVKRYAQAMAEDIQSVMEEEGVGVEEATRRVLSDNAPLVVGSDEEHEEPSATRSLLFTIVNSALAIGVRLGTEALLRRMVDVEDAAGGTEAATNGTAR